MLSINKRYTELLFSDFLPDYLCCRAERMRDCVRVKYMLLTTFREFSVMLNSEEERAILKARCLA